MSYQSEFELPILKKALSLHDKFGKRAEAIILATNDWVEWDRLERLASGVPLLRKNLDYGEGWFGSIEEIKKNRLKRLKSRVKKRKKKASEEYCAKEDVKKYWGEAGDDEAVQEFLKYLDEVKCN